MPEITITLTPSPEAMKALMAISSSLVKLSGMKQGDVKFMSDEADETAPVKKSKAKTGPAEDENFDLEAGSDDAAEEDEAEEKVTKKDLIKLCHKDRETAIKLLKKLKLKSIEDLKPAQYAKFAADLRG